MPTLLPRNITPEMLEKAMADLREVTGTDNQTPCGNEGASLACLSATFMEAAQEIERRSPDRNSTLLTVIALAMSTGIEVARAAPGWSLLAQEELETWFHQQGAVNDPPSSHEVQGSIIRDFVERHPLDMANDEQDIIREKVLNERQPVG